MIGIWNVLSASIPDPTESPESGEILVIPPRSWEVLCAATNLTVGILLESPSQLLVAEFNCTYDCFTSCAS
jgi:hypothetical protein